MEAPDPVFQEGVKQALGNDYWVVDGNYHQVRDIVWSRADSVVWLDDSFRIIMSRLAGRTFRRVFTRETLWKGNQEYVGSLFSRGSVFWWAIKTYRKRRREYPALLGKPENSHLTLVRLRSPSKTREWLSTLE